ncbi:hypothetical protein HTS88_12295 [Pseudarthrobacter oxydans]|nr:hypothetical protein [Pseudarthrobacter oxydans]
MPAAAALACLLIGAPAAHAVFTTSSTSAMTASALVLAAPAGNTASTSCSPIGNSGKHRLSISVTSHGTVPRATNYVLRVKDPAGTTQAIVDLTPGGYFQAGAAAGGWWTYSIEAQYQVPGSTNVWTSTAPQLSVYC